MIAWLREHLLSRRRALRDRLTFLIAIAVFLALALTGLAAYVFTVTAVYEQLDSELVGVASIASESLADDLETMDKIDMSNLQAANVVVSVLRADNTLISNTTGTRILISPAELSVARTGEGWSARTGLSASGAEYRIIAVPLNSHSNHYALVLARPLEPTTKIVNSLLYSLTFFGGLGLFLAAAVGYSIARSTTAPLRQLTDGVAHVTATDQLRPITVGGNDEVADLGRAFNKMLAALASSRDRQRRLIADAGHELRTPLTSMRTNVELLVADEKSGMLPEGARADILRDVAAQLGEFTTLIGDLVQLSREDAVQPHPEPIDFRAVVDSALTRVKRRSKAGMEWDVALENSLFLTGEPDALERAVTNLLDNAVKFSPENSTVHVWLSGDRLRIADEGPGISDADLPHVFERFYRSDKARTTPGSGLGLSIVAQTIQAHGGWVKAGHAPEGGAEFLLRLPGSTTDPDDEKDLLPPHVD